MQIKQKFRTCLLTFILLISSLSVLIITPAPIGAQDIFDDLDDFSEDFLIAFGMHPFVTAGWYEYSGDEDLKISGDITFDLYYTSTILNSMMYKDDLKVTIYRLTDNEFDYLTGNILDEIEKANATIELKPDYLDDTIQKCSVTLEDVNITLKDGDILIFAVETIQSDKPIGNIIANRYEKKLKSRIEKVAELLENSRSDQLKELGSTIIEVLNISEEFGIDANQIGNLVDSFSSASFVYNSNEYKSSVTLPISSEENLVLYFNKTSSDDLLEEAQIIMTEDVPNGSTSTWPVRLFSFDMVETPINQEEWMGWFIFWLQYITIGATPDNELDQNIVTYYLTSDKKLVTEEPTSSDTSRNKITDVSTWQGIALPRSKIIKNATADLYLYFSKILLLRKITVNVSLYDITANLIVASKVKDLERTKILELITRGPNSPTVFEFDEAKGKELYYDHEYGLKISATGGPRFTLRSTFLLCGSDSYPSSITFDLEDTENIKINNDLEDKKIITGGTAEYVLNISSNYTDTINIEVTSEDLEELDNWVLTYPGSIDIEENGNTEVTVFVKSIDDTLQAYGNEIDLIFNVGGKTGFASKKANVEVSEEAVDFDVDVKKPANKDIKHGTSGKYTFVITNNNTGILPDTYEIDVESEHDWKLEVSYDENDLEDVAYGDKFYVNVTVHVPFYTEICSDKLMLTITSLESEKYDKDYTNEIIVKTIVILPNVFENAYHFFEGVASDMGLDEVLGDFAAGFLIFFVIFIIVIFLVIIIMILRRKYVEIICLQRIKEIDASEYAEYDIQINNPHKDKLTYEISANIVNSSDGWEVSLDTQNIIVQSKESVAVKLFVRPTDLIKKDDWVEVVISAKPVEKKKSAEISIITTIKPTKPELKITGVLHWPRVFKKGDKIITSFIVRNTGNVAAHNVSIVLLVNGKEKNKVQDITIPRGGYAEVEIPWVAVKGKNEVNIVVK